MAIRNIVHIDEDKCNGCGLCVPSCAEGAIKIIDGKARLIADKYCDGLGACLGKCPRGAITVIEREADKFDEKSTSVSHSAGDISISIKSQLKQWPVQLMLVPAEAPYFNGADLLITADCAAVAYPNYHLGMLKGKTVVMGCPKLDDRNYYVEKLSKILSANDINSITVLHMEVPCCFGMVKIAEEALRRSGKNIPVKAVKISIEGQVMD